MDARYPAYPKGLTFDDVLLLPGFSDFTRADIDLSTKLTKTISLKLPLLSSPMDTVTEAKQAIALARLGGLGVIHRNLSATKQVTEVSKVKRHGLMVGAAISTFEGYLEQVGRLLNAGVDVIVIDSAHGNTKFMTTAISQIKKRFPKAQIIAGNIATGEGASHLIKAGADGLRVGMGPGSICTTRIISGMGVPQITAILETAKVASRAKVPVIADGGIKQTGDVTKALAAGASTVMLGSMLAGTAESPGRIVELAESQVPNRFQSILNAGKKYKFKQYRGMGSVAAMKRGGAERYGQKQGAKQLIAEGVEGYTPYKGALNAVVEQIVGGLRSGMYYVGAKTIAELWAKARFIEVSQASLTESHPHDLLISDFGSNYKA